jgi:anti-sigma B factor antagonist
MRDAPLSVTATNGTRDGVTVLALDGPLTLPNIFTFQETVGQHEQPVAQHEPQLLIIDLTHSPYIDSAGLGSLMNAYVHAQKSGRTLLLAGANLRVNALLEMTRVHLILKNYATVADAEASARG